MLTNLIFLSGQLKRLKNKKNRVAKACETIDRDPSELTYSVALVACVGGTDNEIAKRAEAIGREVKELRENGLAGTPAEALETLQKWRDAGADRMYLQVLNLEDLDHIGLMGQEFIGQL
jgi:alkanesulfonate monooxygenase